MKRLSIKKDETKTLDFRCLKKVDVLFILYSLSSLVAFQIAADHF